MIVVKRRTGKPITPLESNKVPVDSSLNSLPAGQLSGPIRIDVLAHLRLVIALAVGTSQEPFLTAFELVVIERDAEARLSGIVTKPSTIGMRPPSAISSMADCHG